MTFKGHRQHKGLRTLAIYMTPAWISGNASTLGLKITPPSLGGNGLFVMVTLALRHKETYLVQADKYDWEKPQASIMKVTQTKIWRQDRWKRMRVCVNSYTSRFTLTQINRTQPYLRHEESHVEVVQSFQVFCAVTKIFENHIKISKSH